MASSCPVEEGQYQSTHFVGTSVVNPNTLNLDPDPGFWPNLDPDPGFWPNLDLDPDPGLNYKL